MFGVLFVVACVALLAKADETFNVGDFFFPGTEFDLDETVCSSVTDCKVYLELATNVTMPNDDRNYPSTELELTLDDSKTRMMLKDVASLPDADEQGVYPDSYIVSKDAEGNVLKTSNTFTFYKSQAYMGSDKITLDLKERGVYSPSIATINYPKNTEVNTKFEHLNSTAEAKDYYINVEFTGVKNCDQFVVFRNKRESEVVAMPTVFNQDDKENGHFISYSKSGNSTGFETQFISNDKYEYNAFAPIVAYTTNQTEVQENPDVDYLDVQWNVNKDNEETDYSDDGRKHFEREGTLNVSATIKFNETLKNRMLEAVSRSTQEDEDMSEEDREKMNSHLFVTFALCHIDRPGDTWVSLDSSCDDYTYDVAPPFKCVLKGKLNDDNNSIDIEEQTESTRVIQTWELNDNEHEPDEYGVYTYDFSNMTFAIEDSNPIPFRIVPLFAVHDKNNGAQYSYKFIPLGNATEVFEIDLDWVPGFLFFLEVFIIYLVILAIIYFAVKFALKKLKENKAPEHKLMNEQPDSEDVSMVDNSDENNSNNEEQPIKKKTEAKEDDRLIENESSKKSDDEDSNIA